MRRRRRIQRRGYHDLTIKYSVDRLLGKLRRLYLNQSKVFCKQLREAREDSGLSQEAAAERLGRPQYFISRVETGRRAVEFIELEQLAQIYGKPISYFATLPRLGKEI